MTIRPTQQHMPIPMRTVAISSHVSYKPNTHVIFIAFLSIKLKRCSRNHFSDLLKIAILFSHKRHISLFTRNIIHYKDATTFPVYTDNGTHRHTDIFACINNWYFAGRLKRKSNALNQAISVTTENGQIYPNTVAFPLTPYNLTAIKLDLLEQLFFYMEHALTNL